MTQVLHETGVPLSQGYGGLVQILICGHFFPKFLETTQTRQFSSTQKNSFRGEPNVTGWNLAAYALPNQEATTVAEVLVKWNLLSLRCATSWE